LDSLNIMRGFLINKREVYSQGDYKDPRNIDGRKRKIAATVFKKT